MSDKLKVLQKRKPKEYHDILNSSNKKNIYLISVSIDTLNEFMKNETKSQIKTNR